MVWRFVGEGEGGWHSAGRIDGRQSVNVSHTMNECALLVSGTSDHYVVCLFLLLVMAPFPTYTELLLLPPTVLLQWVNCCSNRETVTEKGKNVTVRGPIETGKIFHQTFQLYLKGCHFFFSSF